MKKLPSPPCMDAPNGLRKPPSAWCGGTSAQGRHSSRRARRSRTGPACRPWDARRRGRAAAPLGPWKVGAAAAKVLWHPVRANHVPVAGRTCYGATSCAPSARRRTPAFSAASSRSEVFAGRRTVLESHDGGHREMRRVGHREAVAGGPTTRGRRVSPAPPLRADGATRRWAPRPASLCPPSPGLRHRRPPAATRRNVPTVPRNTHRGARTANRTASGHPVRHRDLRSVTCRMERMTSSSLAPKRS